MTIGSHVLGGAPLFGSVSDRELWACASAVLNRRGLTGAIAHCAERAGQLRSQDASVGAQAWDVIGDRVVALSQPGAKSSTKGSN